MAYTTIDDPSQYFQTKIWTGDGNDDRNLTNDGNSDLQPDFLWDKRRSTTGSHKLIDSNRGVTKPLSTNNTNAEGSESNAVQAFQTDGFQVGNDSNINGNGVTYVAWQWKANGGTTASNSNGSITSTVQANTTAGFSIVTFTGNTTAGATVGHGLGVAPDYVQVRRFDRSGDAWRGFWSPLGNEKYLELNATDAQQDSTTGAWNDTSPTSSVFSLGSAAGINGGSMIAYCFASIPGYSKIGSYFGNGNADGPFVYTGFKPAWLMIKVFNGNTGGWDMYDNKRGSYNGQISMLQANASAAEATSDGVDFLSNGFKIRHTSGNQNGNGNSHVYLAFAEHPFVSSKGVPVTAR